MNLTRRDPSASLPTLQDIQSNMNRLFDEALGDVFARGRERTRMWAPPVEIYDTDTDLVLLAELPGFEKGEINISFENGQLTFSGERKPDQAENRNYHRNERFYGRFERSFQLPVSVDVNKIKAHLKDGVLTVNIPKKQEARARQIAVSVD